MIKASMTGIAIGLQHEAIVLLSARACAGFTGHDTRFGSLRWRFILRWLSEFNQQSHFKGDLQAVVRAILLDTEAQTGHQTTPNTFGKLREPMLKISALWRAFNATGTHAI